MLIIIIFKYPIMLIITKPELFNYINSNPIDSLLVIISFTKFISFINFISFIMKIDFIKLGIIDILAIMITIIIIIIKFSIKEM
jgi:hypothetical protein